MNLFSFNYSNLYFKEHISLDLVSQEVSSIVPSFLTVFNKLPIRLFTKFVYDYLEVGELELPSENPINVTDI